MKFKQILQNSVLPFALFTGALSLLGCDQVAAPASYTEKPDQHNVEAEQTEVLNTEVQHSAADLKSGNMFYIVRDVADMQLKAGSYVEQLKQTQSDIETAVSSQDPIQLQKAADQLQQQLKGFNQALSGLNLKSTEINDIRSNLQAANQQVLASPFLNGQMDLTQVDIQKIKNQMGNIQLEMVKLASMIISDHSAQEKTSES
ncbi:hypothetical protein ACG9WQ_013430 [Acinetobacter variabilis]|uniref:hypothetical protein n=1 Tax=Acinetobacter variabilis TaxID=70346 RepID=UPI003AF4C1BB